MSEHGYNLRLQKRPQSDKGEEDMSANRPLKRPKSEPDEEDMVHARKVDVAPRLTCLGCNGFFRGALIYCQNKHSLCSICFGDKNKCPTTGCGQKAFLTLDFPADLVKDLKFPISCKFKKDGCDQENPDEEVIADHEIECRYRKVSCFLSGCTDQLAMVLESHIFSAHDAAYGKCRDNPGKWFFCNFSKTDILGAQNIWMDSESGLTCRAVLCHNEKRKIWTCQTIVFGGKNIAKKFRAEMRLSSYDVDTSAIFNGNVSCLDDWQEFDASTKFHISDEQFKVYNKGHIELGDHNKDKNGELMIPVTIKIKKKKLNA